MALIIEKKFTCKFGCTFCSSLVYNLELFESRVVVELSILVFRHVKNRSSSCNLDYPKLMTFVESINATLAVV